MNNFTFYNPARIVFGKDTELKAGSLIKEYGTRVLVHFGGHSAKASGLLDRVIDSLQKEGITVFELGGVKPNPRYSLVKEGIELCKKENIQAILAVGGGSVIDSAKAIAFGALIEEDVWDYYLYGKAIKQILPLGVVLTIPAAGSESSTSTVITHDETLIKRGLGSPLFIPKFAIINPELHYSLPKFQTACGIVDMSAHLIERYFTQVEHNDLTDRLIEANLKSIIANALPVLENPTDYNARAEIAFCGTLAHNGLFSVGRVGDWASHSIEHELSAKFDIAHGAGLAMIIPWWMRHVYKEGLYKFVQFAQRVFDVQLDVRYPELIALEGIRRLELFYQSLGLDTNTVSLPIDEEVIHEMTEKIFVARESQTLGFFKPLTRDDIKAIYRSANQK